MIDNMLAYLKADRQWTRTMRIAHAKHQMATAKTDREREFFKTVLDINGHGDDPHDRN